MRTKYEMSKSASNLISGWLGTHQPLWVDEYQPLGGKLPGEIEVAVLNATGRPGTLRFLRMMRSQSTDWAQQLRDTGDLNGYKTRMAEVREISREIRRLTKKPTLTKTE